MTTLLQIPQTQTLHLPTPTSTPLPLSTGDLLLTLLPANPPSQPNPSLILSIGSSSFGLSANAKVQRVKSNREHCGYEFRALTAGEVDGKGGKGVGKVRIVLKDSKNQGEWEATEALCRKFEEILKSHDVWDERELFVNDEYETAGEPVKGWGETVAGAVLFAGQAFAERFGAYTERHITTTDPVHPAPPSQQTADFAATAKETTNTLSTHAEVGAAQFGEAIHDGGRKLGSYLPESIATAAQPLPEGEKGEYRKMAEDGWEQATIAAKGIASATSEVAGALSRDAHRAIEHNFGEQAEGVAQDMGQAGANLGTTALSVAQGTSAIIQGGNIASGVVNSKAAE